MQTPPAFSVAQIWAQFPPSLHKALLLSSDGSHYLSSLVQEHLPQLTDQNKQLLIGIFADMLLCAWESTFLDPALADAILRIHTVPALLSKEAAAFAALCAQAKPASKAERETADRLVAEQNMPGLKAFLDTGPDRNSLFRLLYARRIGICGGETEWYEQKLAGCAELPKTARRLLQADVLFARDEFAVAARLYEKIQAEMPLPGILVRWGECLLRTGRTTDAVALWSKALASRPWQGNLILRLTDALAGRSVPAAPPPGQGHILLYSWNHGPDLDRALAALAASELGSARLIALNNGSTDTVSDVLAAWRERMGERLRVINLPVNVGAPAARNWLLHEPDATAGDWVVFLDDDALVPPDWLGWFGSALAAHPEAGIIGCRVVEQPAPLSMQHVDLHFSPAKAAARTGHPGNSTINTHINEADFGQYSYLRPCVSVTGCCHLFTRASIERVGDFDLRFSPSQFDDFERDVRACLGGEIVLYQGHLRVRHKRNTVTAMTARQQGQIFGNLTKLWKTYTPEEVEQVTDADLRRLADDMRERLRMLD